MVDFYVRNSIIGMTDGNTGNVIVFIDYDELVINNNPTVAFTVQSHPLLSI